MRSKIGTILLLLVLTTALLSACGQQQDPPANTVEQYLKGLVTQNRETVSSLSCKAWEPDAMTELDSFQLVKATLDQVECKSAEQSTDGTTVACTGAIVSTYNEEQSRIDLSRRNYLVTQEGGDYFVCGYR